MTIKPSQLSLAVSLVLARAAFSQTTGPSTALYFTAGPNAEQDGIFSRLNAVH